MSQHDKHTLLLHTKLVQAVIRIERESRPIGFCFLSESGVAVALRDVFDVPGATLRNHAGDLLTIEGVAADDPETGLVLLKLSGKLPEALPLVRGAGSVTQGSKVHSVLAGGSADTNTLEDVVQIPCWATLFRFEPKKALAPGTPIVNRKGQVIAIAIAFPVGGNAGAGLPAALIPAGGKNKPMPLSDWLSVRSPSVISTGFTEAYAALRNGDSAGAIDKIETLVAGGSRQATHFVLAGLLHEGMGQIEKGETAYRRAVELSPNHPIAWKALGEMLAKQNRTGEALEALEHARKANPEEASVSFQLATLYTTQKETAKALAALRESVRLDPMYLPAVLALGLVYENEGRFGDAYQLYRRVIGTYNRVPDLLLHFGVCAHRLGHLPEALQALRACVELIPENLLAHLSLGNALVAAGEADEARQVLEKSLERFPGEPRLMLQLGLVSKQAGRRQESLQWFEKALASGIDNPDFFRMLAHDHAELGDLDKAADFLQRAIEHTGEEEKDSKSLLYGELGNLFLKAGDRNRAIEAYRQSVALAPQNVTGYLSLGRELFRMEKYDDAALILTQARRLNADDIEIGMTLGLVLEKLLDWEGAAAVYQQVVPRLPHDADAWYRLAWCHVRAGDQVNGEKVLRKVVKLAPQYGPAHYLLGHLCEASMRPSEALEHYKKSAETTPGAFDPLVQTGKLYLQLKQWRRAAVYFGKAVETDPSRPEGHAGLAESLSGVGEKESAMRSLDALRHISPETADELSARLRKLED